MYKIYQKEDGQHATVCMDKEMILRKMAIVITTKTVGSLRPAGYDLVTKEIRQVYTGSFQVPPGIYFGYVNENGTIMAIEQAVTERNEKGEPTALHPELPASIPTKAGFEKSARSYQKQYYDLKQEVKRVTEPPPPPKVEETVTPSPKREKYHWETADNGDVTLPRWRYDMPDWLI